ncbi:MAG TPA: chemotaxis protein CheW [Rhodanobacteraceae bacterium]|jgi:twitching motility protein PilI|nr:chemotaxis protein CheW [Rhodanobacteraceae bacterium]
MGKRRTRENHASRSSGRRHAQTDAPDAAAEDDDVAAVQPEGAFALLIDYERRSLAHDPGVPEQIEAPGLWRAIGFRVGDRNFVSGIDEISEILMSPPPVTTIPSTRPWLLGVANVRGNLIALVDLKQFLFEQRTHVTGRVRVLVVRQTGGNVGLLVDELLGQRNLTEADRVGAEGEADAQLAKFVTENVTLGSARLGRFSMVELTRAPEFQHAAL